MPVVRYLDLIVLALALPVFVVAGWPMLGYAAGAVAWLAQRAIQALDDRAGPRRPRRTATSSASPATSPAR